MPTKKPVKKSEPIKTKKLSDVGLDHIMTLLAGVLFYSLMRLNTNPKVTKPRKKDVSEDKPVKAGQKK